MTPDVMILAAGFGTRMGQLVADRPKPLLEVAGRPLLDHAIEAARAGGGRIAVNAHYRAGQIAAHLGARHPDVTLSLETPEILDSGGGLKQALEHLATDPVATLNADAVWSGPPPIPVLCGAWSGGMGALMLLVPRDRAVGRQGGGDVAMDAEGRLRWDRSDRSFVYTGAQLIAPGPVASHPARVFSLRETWAALIDEGRLFGTVYPGRWADVGHPQGIVQAEEMLAHG
ncbi:NTP transferase domain-containing protein [Rhodobacterales bacterium HKCCSP123]|nr:NTP transferase domain-containing protein [Rhodobacterales bacterium HKCCSP123]